MHSALEKKVHTLYPIYKYGIETMSSSEATEPHEGETPRKLEMHPLLPQYESSEQMNAVHQTFRRRQDRSRDPSDPINVKSLRNGGNKSSLYNIIRIITYR